MIDIQKYTKKVLSVKLKYEGARRQAQGVILRRMPEEWRVQGESKRSKCRGF